MVTLHQLINYTVNEVDLEKTFLLLGGIKNAVYYFKINSMQIIGMGGTGEINCPGIFDILHMEYETLPPEKFINLIDNKQLDYTNYFYIIPVLSELLNRNVADVQNIGMLGQSFFIVDYISQGKIYFKFDYEMTFMDIEILRKLTVNEKWVVESEFGIYAIDKRALKNNQFITNMCKKNKTQLTKETVDDFFIDSKILGDKGTIRIDGPKVYDLILEHFKNIKAFLNSIEDENKYKGFLKYIYIQVLHIRKFILSGTDAYYRNEFNCILHTLWGQNPLFQKNFQKWDTLELLWRNFGRQLSKNVTYKNILDNQIEILDIIIDFIGEIKRFEIDTLKECKILLEKIDY